MILMGVGMRLSGYSFNVVLYSVTTFFLTSCLLFFPGFAFADGMPEGYSSGVVSKSSAASSKQDNSSSESVDSKLPAYSLTEDKLKKFQYCGKDSDCIQVVNGCCQCLQGDPMAAINRKHLSAFRNQFACEKVKCADDNSTHSCMEGVVSCINFSCRYFPPEE